MSAPRPVPAIRSSGNQADQSSEESLRPDSRLQSVCPEVVIHGWDAQRLHFITDRPLVLGELGVNLLERHAGGATQEISHLPSANLMLGGAARPVADEISGAGKCNDDTARQQAAREVLQGRVERGTAGHQADHRRACAETPIEASMQEMQPDLIPDVENGLSLRALDVRHVACPSFGAAVAAVAPAGTAVDSVAAAFEVNAVSPAVEAARNPKQHPWVAPFATQLCGAASVALEPPTFHVHGSRRGGAA